MAKLFYSFEQRNGYFGDAPAYFHEDDFEWVSVFQGKSEMIRNELSGFVKSGQKFWSYANEDMVSKKNGWTTIPLKSWGVNFRKNQKQAPVTMGLLNSIPGLVSASFNLLEAGTEIGAHNGDTDAIVRCHFGLVIPGKLPELGFKVDGEDRCWEEGRLLMFTDAHEHMAWNRTKADRFILLFDVVLDKHLSKKRRISSKVLASLFLQNVSHKMPFLKKLPMFIQATLYFVSIGGAYVTVPIRNFFSWLTVRL